MSWTLTEAQNMLQLWMDAEAALATAQQYTINVGGNSRTLVRTNLAEVKERISFWRREVDRLDSTGSSGPKIRYINPL